ncbi:uncharacterized protein G2W53_003344 [Senna tora]|uniref:DUF8204 domain-containing protein n=1 Tax=Senna tora TaxID=362788 RepID=A0A835CFN7_9FABA|nr:uncharacterized protein G2W53_003344 [Senna tora]
MEVNKRDNEGEGEAQTQNPIPNPNPNPSHPQTRGFEVKSCKGGLYYSSALKSKSKNPKCVGFSRSLQQVSSPSDGTQLDASKKDLSRTEFKYACVGYSVYLDNKDSSADQLEKIAKLPICIGLEVLLEKEPTTAASGNAPTPNQKNEERGQAIPQRRYKPPSTRMEEYFNRFKRNSELVASRVVRNLYRVGNMVKDSIDDIRRGPK